jgi:hypothetical protein
MRVLEARFHSRTRGEDEVIVVARVVWYEEPNHPSVQPSPSLLETTAAGAMLAKLQFLIESAAPDTFDRLKALKSQYWSFADVTPAVERLSR